MSDEAASRDSSYELPRNPFEQPDKPRLPMVQMVTKFVVLYQLYLVVHYFIKLGFFTWQELGPQFLHKPVGGFPLALESLDVMARVIILKGALDALVFLETGRRLMVAGTMIILIVFPSTEIIEGYYYQNTRHLLSYGPCYALYDFSLHLMSAVGGCILSLFIWRYYRHAEVKALFGVPIEMAKSDEIY